MGKDRGLPAIDTVAIDLRSIHTCVPEGPCVTVPLSALKGGLYPTLAMPTFWGNLVLAAVVAWSAVLQLRGLTASEAFVRSGYALAIACFAGACLVGFFFGPESGAFQDVSLSVHRTWAPGFVLLGDAAAVVALYLAAHPPLTDEAASYQPIEVPVATARVAAMPLDTPPPPQRRSAVSVPMPLESVPMRPAVRLPAPARIPSEPGAGIIPSRTATAPIGLRGRVAYAVASAELSAAGIDARREDGAAKLVMWRDIVGIVTRRLPPERPFDGETFVDLVSTAGSTLRILPWTRLTGDPIAGDDADRARAVAALAEQRTTEAQIDPATRRFLDGSDAAQLPDAATLAAHDERLA
jgi:hypothetical protein